MIRSVPITIRDVGLLMEEVNFLQVGMVTVGMITDREVGLGLVTEMVDGMCLIWISCLGTSQLVGFFSILGWPGNYNDLY